MKLSYNFFFALLMCSLNSYTPAQNNLESSKTQVMILGTFHFAYPNLDRIKTKDPDKIDFSTPERQKEIEELVQQLAKFKPTKIAVEMQTWTQAKNDSLYNEYLKGSFSLPINESYTLGFRLAKLLGLERVYCVDDWGNINEYFDGNNKTVFKPKAEKVSMLNKLEAYSDSLLKIGSEKISEDSGKKDSGPNTLQNILYKINQPEKIKNDHSAYLKGLFLFEEEKGDYTGVDWISASWFNRNLRIFRNIQRITDKPGDRILVIYGSGHLYLLTNFLEASSNYTIVPVLDFLRNNK